MKQLFRILTNKFLLSGVIFTIWMVYFDQNDYFTIRQKKKEYKEVKSNVDYLNAETTRMQKELAALMAYSQPLEQLARESYHMKKDNEDVYVIERK